MDELLDRLTAAEGDAEEAATSVQTSDREEGAGEEVAVATDVERPTLPAADEGDGGGGGEVAKGAPSIQAEGDLEGSVAETGSSSAPLGKEEEPGLLGQTDQEAGRRVEGDAPASAATVVRPTFMALVGARSFAFSQPRVAVPLAAASGKISVGEEAGGDPGPGASSSFRLMTRGRSIGTGLMRLMSIGLPRLQRQGAASMRRSDSGLEMGGFLWLTDVILLSAAAAARCQYPPDAGSD